MRIAEKVVFVDGVSGSGKSILGPILASFDRVERYRLDCVYEHIAVLHKFGKIDSDAATVLIRLHLDEALYHSMISREVNFRPFDHTGFLNNPFRLRSIVRLFTKDGDAAVERIHRVKPIFQVNCHQMFPAIRLAFLAFGPRVRAVEMVRHPLFVVQHWVQFAWSGTGRIPGISRCGSRAPLAKLFRGSRTDGRRSSCGCHRWTGPSAPSTG